MTHLCVHGVTAAKEYYECMFVFFLSSCPCIQVKVTNESKLFHNSILFILTNMKRSKKSLSKTEFFYILYLLFFSLIFFKGEKKKTTLNNNTTMITNDQRFHFTQPSIPIMCSLLFVVITIISCDHLLYVYYCDFILICYLFVCC